MWSLPLLLVLRQFLFSWILALPVGSHGAYQHLILLETKRVKEVDALNLLEVL